MSGIDDRFFWTRGHNGPWDEHDTVGSFLTPGQPWADRVRAMLPADPDGLDLASRFLTHLALSDTTPSKRWITATREVLIECPQLVVLTRGMLTSFLDLLDNAPAPSRTREGELNMPEWRLLLDSSGADWLIRGAIWALVAAAPPWAPELLVRAAPCARGVNCEGGNLLRIATAAVRGLGAMGALEQLATTEARLTHRGVRKSATIALAKGCAAAGRTVEQVREGAVDSFGLEAGGRMRMDAGDVAAELQVQPTGVALTWVYGGQRRTSLPRQARESNPDLVAAVKTEVKRLRAGVTAERARLERMMISGSTRPVCDWLQPYGQHPLTSPLSRNLLWRIEDRLALPGTEPGTFEDLHQLWRPGLEAAVSLAHPLLMEHEELAQWRALLIDRRLRQPFAQAFRELYQAPAADADSDSTTCLAGRVLQYRQFDALLRIRGWNLPYRGSWDRGDSDFTAERELAGVKASWDIGEFDGDQLSLGFVCTGPLRLSTTDSTPIALRDVPPVVLSEILRDVDLVATTADIARDGQWAVEGDRILHTAFRDQAFGDLTTAGITRRETLRLILPITDLAPHCTIDGSILHVNGHAHRYAIHLGTGQIARDSSHAVLPGFTPKQIPGLFLPTEDPLLENILRCAHALITGTEQP